MSGPPGTFVPRAPRLLGTEVLSTDARCGQEPFVSAVPRFGAPPLPSLLGDAGFWQAAPAAAAAPTRPPGLHGPPGLLVPAAPDAKSYQPGSLLVRSANLPGMPWKLQPGAGLKLPTPARNAAPLLVSGPRAAPAPTPPEVVQRSSICDTEEPAHATEGAAPAEAAHAAVNDSVAKSAAAGAASVAQVGSLEIPTRGSSGHGLGKCKPCAFVFKGGCKTGPDCKFCHLCPPDEKKTRKKNWKEQKKARDEQRAPGGGQADAGHP